MNPPHRRQQTPTLCLAKSALAAGVLLSFSVLLPFAAQSSTNPIIKRPPKGGGIAIYGLTDGGLGTAGDANQGDLVCASTSSCTSRFFKATIQAHANPDDEATYLYPDFVFLPDSTDYNPIPADADPSNYQTKIKVYEACDPSSFPTDYNAAHIIYVPVNSSLDSSGSKLASCEADGTAVTAAYASASGDKSRLMVLPFGAFEGTLAYKLSYGHYTKAQIEALAMKLGDVINADPNADGVGFDDEGPWIREPYLGYFYSTLAKQLDQGGKHLAYWAGGNVMRINPTSSDPGSGKVPTRFCSDCSDGNGNIAYVGACKNGNGELDLSDVDSGSYCCETSKHVPGLAAGSQLTQCSGNPTCNSGYTCQDSGVIWPQNSIEMFRTLAAHGGFVIPSLYDLGPPPTGVAISLATYQETLKAMVTWGRASGPPGSFGWLERIVSATGVSFQFAFPGSSSTSEWIRTVSFNAASDGSDDPIEQYIQSECGGGASCRVERIDFSGNLISSRQATLCKDLFSGYSPDGSTPAIFDSLYCAAYQNSDVSDSGISQASFLSGAYDTVKSLGTPTPIKAKRGLYCDGGPYLHSYCLESYTDPDNQTTTYSEAQRDAIFCGGTEAAPLGNCIDPSTGAWPSGTPTPPQYNAAANQAQYDWSVLQPKSGAASCLTTDSSGIRTADSFCLEGAYLGTYMFTLRPGNYFSDYESPRQAAKSKIWYGQYPEYIDGPDFPCTDLQQTLTPDSCAAMEKGPLPSVSAKSWLAYQCFDPFDGASSAHIASGHEVQMSTDVCGSSQVTVADGANGFTSFILLAGGAASGLYATENSDVRIQGGTVGSLKAFDSSMVDLFGTALSVDTGGGFEPVDPGELPPGTGAARLSLASGEIMEFDFQHLSDEVSGTILFVPEPSAGAGGVVAVLALTLLRRARGKRAFRP
ncbi:MAG: hypothetical protein OSB70_14555 [Myxococcota bacterium]|nr:hypothetical protein [Myxococcota bacterium]